MTTRVRFQGQEYLLVGDLDNGAAICTPEAYANGECSFAHLGRDGIIRRFKRQIGVKADLEVLGEAESPALSDDAFDNLGTHPTWRAGE